MPPLTTQMALHKDKWLTPPLNDFIQLTQEFFAGNMQEINDKKRLPK